MDFDPDELIRKRREQEDLGVKTDPVTGQPVASPRFPAYKDDEQDEADDGED